MITKMVKVVESVILGLHTFLRGEGIIDLSRIGSVINLLTNIGVYKSHLEPVFLKFCANFYRTEGKLLCEKVFYVCVCV